MITTYDDGRASGDVSALLRLFSRLFRYLGCLHTKTRLRHTYGTHMRDGGGEEALEGGRGREEERLPGLPTVPTHTHAAPYHTSCRPHCSYTASCLRFTPSHLAPHTTTPLLHLALHYLCYGLPYIYTGYGLRFTYRYLGRLRQCIPVAVYLHTTTRRGDGIPTILYLFTFIVTFLWQTVPLPFTGIVTVTRGLHLPVHCYFIVRGP